MLCAFGHSPPSPNLHLAPNGAWRGKRSQEVQGRGKLCSFGSACSQAPARSDLLPDLGMIPISGPQRPPSAEWQGQGELHGPAAPSADTAQVQKTWSRPGLLLPLARGMALATGLCVHVCRADRLQRDGQTARSLELSLPCGGCTQDRACCCGMKPFRG